MQDAGGAVRRRLKACPFRWKSELGLRCAARCASLAMVVICIATFGAEAGRKDAPPQPPPAPAPMLKCPPKIVPKCKLGEKPYCAELSGKCCRAVSCRVKK